MLVVIISFLSKKKIHSFIKLTSKFRQPDFPRLSSYLVFVLSREVTKRSKVVKNILSSVDYRNTTHDHFFCLV